MRPTVHRRLALACGGRGTCGTRASCHTGGVTPRRIGWFLRGALVVLTFVSALLAFQAGVGVSARNGLEGADLLTHVYYALGLFVLGGMDLGLPRGGPPIARDVLWASYFLAPAITTSAVVEGAVRLLQPQWLQRRALHDHIVIVGAGRLGMLFLEALRTYDKKVRVLVVDRDGTQGNLQQAVALHGTRFVLGDVRTTSTLDAMVLERARAVALLTDDDLVNLEAAWRIAARAPRADVVVHVADIGMRRTVARVEGSTAERVHVFNAHRIAAQRLYEEHLELHFANTAAEDVVVLAGFGRFGQTILEYLQREAEGEVQRAIVVDVAAEQRVRLFRAQVPGFESCNLVTIQGDLDDPVTWERVEQATRGLGVEPVFVIGTDDEQINLRTAIAQRSLHPSARIFVRCVYESAFTAQLSQQLRFEVLAVEGMLSGALRDHVAQWIEPAS